MSKGSGKFRSAMASALKIVISLILIGVLVSKVSISEITDTIMQADIVSVIGALGIFALVNFLTSYKWQMLLKAQGYEISFRQVLITYMEGLFFNNFLPTGFGGDIVRAYRIARKANHGANAILAVSFDRAHSLTAMLWLAFPCYFYSATLLGLPWEVGVVLAALVIGITGIVMIFLLFPIHNHMETILRALPPMVSGYLSDVLLSLFQIGKHMELLFWASILAIICQLLGFFVQYLLFTSLQVSISFPVLVSVVSIAALATLLPISLNGIGVREGTFVLLLGSAGISNPTAVAISFLSLIVLTVISLFGGILYIIRGWHNFRSTSKHKIAG